jgi:hypothetical protein
MRPGRQAPVGIAAPSHIHQQDRTTGLGAMAATSPLCDDGEGRLRAGNFNEASLMIDKPVVKHVDVDAGLY